MALITINQKTLTFDNLTPDLTNTLLDALTTNQISPQDIYTMLKTIDTKENHIYIEQLLLKTKEINQFINSKDDYYLLALYIELTIAKIGNYTSNINELFRTNDFKNLLGYYFIYQKKDTHNLLKNDPISNLGKSILRADGDIVKWMDGEDSLYDTIKEKYPRAAVFDNKFECMEGVLMDIKTDNVSDEYIEQVKNYVTKYNSDSFKSDVYFYVGQIYHKRKDYLNARVYYEMSQNENAIYNLMRITRNIVDDNEKYNKITNYIKLINNRTDFIEPIENIYKVKLSERWCGGALLAYYKSESISKEIRTINMSYYYYRCLEDNEMEVIEQFYSLVKDKVDTKYDIAILFGLDCDSVIACTNYIVSQLYNLDTDLSYYNLSFFLPKPVAISILKSIEKKDEHILARLAILSNCLETAKEVVPINPILSKILLGNFYYTNKNYSQAKEIFKGMDEEYSNAMLAYIYYIQYKKSGEKTNLGMMVKHLKNYQNVYIVYLVAILLYEKRWFEKCIELLNNLIVELKRERNVHRKHLLRNCNLLMGFCYLYKKSYEDGMKYIEKSGNKDLLEKIQAVLQ